MPAPFEIADMLEAGETGETIEFSVAMIVAPFVVMREARRNGIYAGDGWTEGYPFRKGPIPLKNRRDKFRGHMLAAVPRCTASLEEVEALHEWAKPGFPFATVVAEARQRLKTARRQGLQVTGADDGVLARFTAAALVRAVVDEDMRKNPGASRFRNAPAAHAPIQAFGQRIRTGNSALHSLQKKPGRNGQERACTR